MENNRQVRVNIDAMLVAIFRIVRKPVFHIIETSSLNINKIEIREKERDLTQSYDKSPYTDRKIKKKKQQRDNTKTPTKTSITQRLRNDLGRSVGVTIATQLVWLNRFTGSQPPH